MTVRIQTADFDLNAELIKLRGSRKDIGAVVSFVGLVRDLNDGDTVFQLTLEHYPEMTEKALENIVKEAKARWQVMEVSIVHRVGTLSPTDQIVFVAVAGAHRGEAFQACEFIMDYLKTSAPFWKKEETPEGSRWVEAKESDDASIQRWQEQK